MSSITAKDIVELFKKDKEATKNLAELLTTQPDIRLAIINAIIRDVATKQDIKELRTEFRQEIEKLRNEFRQETNQIRNEVGELREKVTALEQRITKIETQVGLLIKLFIAFNIPILTALIGILLKMIF